MWPLLFLLFSALLAVLSVLVWWRARSVWQWKLAVLAGEYSAPWGALSALLLVSSYWIRDGAPAALVGSGRLLAAAALVGFMRPWVLGTALMQRLPFLFDQAFARPPGDFFPSHLAAVPAVPPRVARQSSVTVTFTGADGSALGLDLFPPPAGLDRAPVVVVVHGGGWDGGDRRELAHFNAWLASCGYLVAAPDYRLAPAHPWPACAEDVRAAISFLRERAAEWMGDGEQIVLLGRSAGGQIAQAVAYQNPPPGLRGLISLYAPADLEFAWQHSRSSDVLDPLRLLSQYLGGPYEKVPEAYRSASPYLSVDENSVPTLLVHGRIDALVWHRQSERLYARLCERGVPAVFLDLPWATHALEYNLNGPSGRLVRTAVGQFLRSVTSPATESSS